MNPVVTIPDGIEPIVAYRAWSCRVDGIEPTLLSLGGHGGDVWNDASDNWVRASCAMFHWMSEAAREAFHDRGLPVPSLTEGDPHAAPAEGCTCGFYALKSVTDAFEMFGRVDRNLIGRVKLAGKVIEHEFGYRAQRARIDALIPIVGNESLTALVALRRGVDVDHSAPLDLRPDGPDCA
jgi:hypothetical protein